MTQVTVEPQSIIDLGTTDGVIEGYRGRLGDLQADTPAGYEAVKAGIRELTTLRTGVERSRKELKANALEWGRKVDAEAKRVMALILEIEEPLKQRKLAVDNEIQRQKDEKREREERERKEAEAAENAKRLEAEKAERERVRKEQDAERAKIEAEREASRKEQEKLQAERRKLDEEKAKLEAAKREQERKEKEAEEARLAAERAEADRIATEKKAEADRIESEKKAEAERIAKEKAVAEQERLAEERRPDLEKLIGFAEQIQQVDRPIVKTDWALERLASFEDALAAACLDMTESAPAA